MWTKHLIHTTLFTLFVLTGLSSGQSSDRRRSSSPIRSVPVSADVKRDTEFDCPEEFGYYPHPTDCSQYYVCVFGGALLESCTGGLMYSHELQTCDWPRNVGCSTTGSGSSDSSSEAVAPQRVQTAPIPVPVQVSRTRAPPPPPPRASPNPVVTSRGQPTYINQQEIVKQQLYAEVDEQLPPAEELENDRQQRVLRGQPQSVGQVQRDRDGHALPSPRAASTARNSIPSGKVGAFSFGTQVDSQNDNEAIIQYRLTDLDLTDNNDISRDNDTNMTLTQTRFLDLIRRKRNAEEYIFDETDQQNNSDREKRQTRYGRLQPNINLSSGNSLNNWYNKYQYRPSQTQNYNSPKVPFKPSAQVEDAYSAYSKNSGLAPVSSSNFYNSRYNDGNFKPIIPESSVNHYSTSNYNSVSSTPNYQYKIKSHPNGFSLSSSTLSPVFKDSFSPFYTTKPQFAGPTITKAPPISSLKTPNENPFSALSGGFFNNQPASSNHFETRPKFSISSFDNQEPLNSNSQYDFEIGQKKPGETISNFSQFPKGNLKESASNRQPVSTTSSTKPRYRVRRPQKTRPNNNNNNNNSYNQYKNSEYRKKPVQNNSNASDDNEEESEEEDEQTIQRPGSSERNESDKSKEVSNEENKSSHENNSSNSNEENQEQSPEIKPEFPDPPEYFKNIGNKYEDVVNPFADPNFDFDTFISRIKSSHESIAGKPKQNAKLTSSNQHSDNISSNKLIKGLQYQGMSTPRPFSATQKIAWPAESKKPALLRPTLSIYNNSSSKPVYENTGSEEYDDYDQPNNNNNKQQHYRAKYENKPNSNYQQNGGRSPQPVYVKISTPSSYSSNSASTENYRKPIIDNVQYHDPPNSYKTSTQSTPYTPSTQTYSRPSSERPRSQNYKTQSDNHNGNSHTTSQSPPPRRLPPVKKQNYRFSTSTTTTQRPTGKRRPIPKPSPEMNDYYYDDEEEEYYYEPPVKSKFMPSTEVKPQRPPIAQNYEEYEDYDSNESGQAVSNNRRPSNNQTSEESSEEYEDSVEESGEGNNSNSGSVEDQRRPIQSSQNYRAPPNQQKPHGQYHAVIPAGAPLSSVTYTRNKPQYTPQKPPSKYPDPQPTLGVIQRPEVTNYEVQHSTRLVPTIQTRPRYLNQTTLRPYTVRHRLAKPTSTKATYTIIAYKPTSEANTRAPTKSSSKYQEQTPSTASTRHFRRPTTQSTTFKTDSDRQETRNPNSQDHDDNAPNRVEPTVSASPTYQSTKQQISGGRALYNGTQQYDPQQYDPYYALYDDDVELYKDADYAQQYNSAAQRPGSNIQQTYRGTPPPRASTATAAPSPILYTQTQSDVYNRKPTADDYDDELIGQIDEQSQYQQPARPSSTSSLDVRNELGYDVSTLGYTRSRPTNSAILSTTTTTSTTLTPQTFSVVSRVQTPIRSTSGESLKGNLIPPPLNSSTTTPSSPTHNINSGEVSSLAKPFSSQPKPSLVTEKVEITNPTKITPPVSSDMNNYTNLDTKQLTYDTVPPKNTSRFLSLTTGFIFKKENQNSESDEQPEYTLQFYKSPTKIPLSEEDEIKKKQSVSFQVQDIPVHNEGNNVVHFEKTDPEDADIQPSSPSRIASPVPIVIENLPEPGQKPIIIQLKSNTGPRTHGPRINPDNRASHRGINRYIDSKSSELLSYPTTTVETTTKPTEIVISESSSKVPQKVYLRQVIKRPAPFRAPENQAEQSRNSFESIEKKISSSEQQYNKGKYPDSFENYKNIPNTLDTLPQLFNRRSGNRDQYLKSDSSTTTTPAVSPFKTLENLRRDIPEKSRNLHAYVSSPSPQTNNKNVIIENVPRFQQQVSSTPLYQNEISASTKPTYLNRYPSTTENPRSQILNRVRNSFLSNPITQNILQTLKYISNQPSSTEALTTSTTTTTPTTTTTTTTSTTPIPTVYIPRVEKNKFTFLNLAQNKITHLSAIDDVSTERREESTTLPSINFYTTTTKPVGKFEPGSRNYDWDSYQLSSSVETSSPEQDSLEKTNQRANIRRQQWKPTTSITERNALADKRLESRGNKKYRYDTNYDFDDSENVPSKPTQDKKVEPTTPKRLEEIKTTPVTYSQESEGESFEKSVAEKLIDPPIDESDELYDEEIDISKERNTKPTVEKRNQFIFNVPSSAIPLKNPLIIAVEEDSEEYPETTTEHSLYDEDEEVEEKPTSSRYLGGFRQNDDQTNENDVEFSTERPKTKTVDSLGRAESSESPPSLSTDTKKPSSPVPSRTLRVNSAIKAAVASRRSYSPVKCNGNGIQSDNCNDIKSTQRTRGRGSAHYSATSTVAASGGNDQITLTGNRGTPPPRARPTLKPSTSIVSKATEFVDIYRYPPRRPENVYPTPQVDKTAAKCRKDVCLLPDCSCGGKDIPGDLRREETPQMVLITFDDAVNDLNKGLYSDLFEKGRINPNGCPISASFYVSHEWTDYSQVQNLYADGHEMASHSVSHSFGEQFSQKKWNREISGQREILAAYGGVKLEDVRGMRAPFLSVGGNKMFKMLYDSNFTYDSSMPVYENRPPSWPYTLDYKLFHDCMIPPCPTKSYPGVWEVPMVMWQDLNGGRCSMGDACSNPPEAENVYKMILKNFDRHYSTNRAPFGLFYHAAWFTQPHHKEGFIMFLDTINAMKDVFIVTNWQALQWVRDPTPLSRINSFQPFHCNYHDRPKRCNNPKVCNLWHKSGVRYMRTCQPCPDIYPWTGKSGIKSSRIDNDIED